MQQISEDKKRLVAKLHVQDGRTISSLAAEYGVCKASITNWARMYRDEYDKKTVAKAVPAKEIISEPVKAPETDNRVAKTEQRASQPPVQFAQAPNVQYVQTQSDDYSRQGSYCPPNQDNMYAPQAVNAYPQQSNSMYTQNPNARYSAQQSSAYTQQQNSQYIPNSPVSSFVPASNQNQPDLASLQNEIDNLKRERDFLKKAAIYFASELGKDFTF